MTDESKLPDPMSVGVASATFDPALGRLYTVHDLHAYVAALAESQAVAAVAEDAGRYRWLRANKYSVGPHVIQFGRADAYIALHGDTLDAAIDAAMKENDHAR